MSKIVFAVLLLASFCAGVCAQSPTFTNPLLPVGPDPWVIYHDNTYYYMNTTGKNLTIWKTKDITDLKSAEKKVVWTRPQPVPIPTRFGLLNCIS